jgi:hypothetical protein
MNFRANDNHDEHLLQGLNRENPFKVPEGYFDSLAENTIQRIQGETELKGVTNENPFHAPEGYFQSLPAVVRQKISENKKGSGISEWIGGFLFHPKFAFVTGMILLLLAFGIKYFSQNKIQQPQEFSISTEDLKNSDYLAEVDEFLIIDALEQQPANEKMKEDQSIEQYLIDNDVDISQLENHL